ncbi:J domain-containing protein [Nocardioides sp. cx-173]|uniref:J domain-containing protein n=1 Tax=Nocardioides sp. cx-173 TaxID=2898796 RepID=UPI001E6472E2|nr:DnaJ domain-containing protein [Nocardioides sp. cx-173]MCD4523999.1 J domain-containing protein [Nocardioides sp. cx-173]UGB41400.1 J domain-containing protein [Nocardioides sp. cx-173]
MTPNWYDLLDVDRDATTEEIRAAWRSAIADLEPDDRRFRVYNEAGAVLLDPERRAAYDATLPQDVDQVHEEHEENEETPKTEGERSGDDRRAGAPLWLIAVLAVVALALVAATGYVWTRPAPVDEDAARAAARAAVVPVLSYDYRTLDEDAATARSYMTPRIRKDYDDTMQVIKDNAPQTKTVVTVEEPLADGVVRSSEDRVDVLLYVNMPTTNAQGTRTYRNQVTLRMVLDEGEWLVDDFTTNLTQR